MTLDTYVEADILATCNALGTEIFGVYEKGTECIDCLKDILRYLKRDSENHDILRCLGSNRLLQTDLLPILKKYHSEEEIFDFTLRILIALTNPAALLYKDLPDDKISRNLYLQTISFLQSYKKAFVDVEVHKVLFEHLKDMLNIRPAERSTDENLIVERIIILIRNILHVPPDESILKQTDDDESLHDKILWSMHESNLYLLILYMAVNEDEHQYCMHILEIASLMLREHTSEVLAQSNDTRSNVEKQKDLDILFAARQREQTLKLQKIKTISGSRFSGVYCVKNMKSLSDKDYISHKYISNVSDFNFDSQKNAKRRPKNRVRAPDIDNTRNSTLHIRLFLKNFCIEFLKAYNKLMVSVKKAMRNQVSDDHDETYYFWAVCFFMQFNRLYEFQVAFVSETISVQTFHHIQTEITNYQEMMLTDKKKQLFWAKRMQFGISAYKELLETLRKMERSTDEVVRDCADALVNHVFYVIEYREMLLLLLTHYDEVKFPMSYLAELVESTQLFLKMLENHSKKHSKIIIQKKQRKIKRRKKKKSVVETEQVNEEEILDRQWDAISSELSKAVIGYRKIPDITPFDGASEMTFEEQKIEAVFKIRKATMEGRPLDAVALLRAARELWPEGDSFGAAEIEPEPEFLIIREIHFSNLKKDDEENPPNAESEEVSDEDEEMESRPAYAEQELNLDEVYKKYASPKVVMPCSLLLANYRNNKSQTNLCLVKLLHRIAWTCKMHALFFQSTIFLTFQKIFHDPDSKQDPVTKELYRFGKFIMQKFFSAVEKNNKIFVELLFWKGAREAYEIEEGYGASEKSTKVWTEEEEEELKYLFEENKDICIEGQDVADIILANFNKNKTKTQIISALKRLDLIKSAKDLKPEKRSEWLESEIIELQHLFEEYKTSNDVMSSILDKLSIKRSRKAVVDKLLELNLIQDRKEVRKKGSKKKKSQLGEGTENDESDENVESDENDDVLGNYDGKNDSESSDENETIFFKNLEAERMAGKNSSKEAPCNSNTLDLFSDSNEETNLNEVWEEQEIMELTSIFNDNHGSENMIDIIINALTIKRPKHDVVQKLLELGLIKDKNDIQKKESSKEKNSYKDKSSKLLKNRKGKMRILSDEDIPINEALSPNNTLMKKSKNDKNQILKKKRPLKVWEEQEVMELTSLFHANEGSNNIMENLLNSLTIKRPKQAVIEKLLELQLIKDKKEVRKKRELKSKKPSSVNNNDLPGIQNILVSSGVEKKKRSKKPIASDSSDEDISHILSHRIAKSDNSNEAFKLKKGKPQKSDLMSFSNISDSEHTIKISNESEKKKRLKKILSDSSDEDILFHSSVLDKSNNSIETSQIKQKEFKSQKVDSLNHDDLSGVENVLNISNRTKKNKKIRKQKLSDSSDEDIPLSSVLGDNSIETIRVMKGDFDSQVFDSVNKDDSSDVEHIPKVLNGFEKKISSKRQILSDSSDEDIPLSHSSVFSKIKSDSAAEIKELPSQSSKKSKLWKETEINELTTLFQENQGSGDILNIISNALTVKRSKQAITETLLNLHLIKDKKEVHKKREKKSKQGQVFNAISSKGNTTELHEQGLVANDELFSNHTNDVKQKSERPKIFSDFSSDNDDPVLKNSHLDSNKTEETVQLSKLLPSEKNKRKRLAVSSDESDDDSARKSLTLKDSMPLNVNNKSFVPDDKLSSNNNVAEEKKNQRPELFDSDEDDASVPKNFMLQDNKLKDAKLMTANNKRRRIMISSDDSDVESITTKNDESKEYSVPKTKKKLRVLLDDSEDSS